MKFYIKDFFSKCDQIRRKHLLKKSLMENFIFCPITYKVPILRGRFLNTEFVLFKEDRGQQRGTLVKVLFHESF